MNVAQSELEVGDADLKRAQLVKMSLEAFAIALTCVIYAQMILDEDVKYRIAQKIKQIRVALFGRPPLTEEQIKEQERQLHIEANRVLRYGE